MSLEIEKSGCQEAILKEGKQGEETRNARSHKNWNENHSTPADSPNVFFFSWCISDLNLQALLDIL